MLTWIAHGNILAVPLDDLPDWLPAWCVDQLGDFPVNVLFELRSMSAVFGLQLAGGRDVVVKTREDDGRAASCVAAQAQLAERGFRAPGRSRLRSASACWSCTPRSPGSVVNYCAATRRTSPCAMRRCSPD